MPMQLLPLQALALDACLASSSGTSTGNTSSSCGSSTTTSPISTSDNTSSTSTSGRRSSSSSSNSAFGRPPGPTLPLMWQPHLNPDAPHPLPGLLRAHQQQLPSHWPASSLAHNALAAFCTAAPAGARATPAPAAGTRNKTQEDPQPGQRARTSLAELQQVIEAELGAQYRLKESAVTASELKGLPGLKLLQSRVAGLRDELGAEAAAQLLASDLRMLTAGPPAGVRARLDALAVACGCDMAAALQMCTQHKGAAQLLLRPPRSLELVLAAVVECLGLRTKKQVHAMVRKGTRVLHYPAGAVRERHAALGGILGLDSDALAELLRRYPNLLAVQPAKVKAGVEAVREVLELSSWEEAVQVATRCPPLLTGNPEHTAPAVRWLKRRLGLSNTELEGYTILFYKTEALLEQRLTQLPDALGIPPAEALHLAKAAPILLLLPSTSAKEAWAALKAAAGLQPQWRAQLLASTLPALHIALSVGGQRLRERIQQVVAAAPAPTNLPALSHLARATEPQFREVMQRVRGGNYKAKWKGPEGMEASISVLLPSLAAQL